MGDTKVDEPTVEQRLAAVEAQVRQMRTTLGGIGFLLTSTLHVEAVHLREDSSGLG